MEMNEEGVDPTTSIDYCVADTWVTFPVGRWLEDLERTDQSLQGKKNLSALLAQIASSKSARKQSPLESAKKAKLSRETVETEAEENLKSNFESGPMPKRSKQAKLAADNQITRCLKCKGVVLRVIETRAGKNLLECANLNCLASIKHTDIPAGTIIDKLKGTEYDRGWHSWPSSEIYYPEITDEHLKDASFAVNKLPPRGIQRVPKELLQSSSYRYYITVPGQKERALLM